MGILGLRDPVGEGPVGLVPVDAHVAGGVVYQVVDVVPQLSGASSARCKSMRGERLDSELVLYSH